ncbi:MAG: hypothetical protein J0I12_11135 [Candidatus Eremiobacteraeota bacterium]|nr:hypothetical protein [Candidatus Eremiobacteraeota bacterium]
MADFDLYCTQSCTHRAVTGTGLHAGQPILGDPVDLNCRVQEELKVTRGPSGDLEVSDSTLFFSPGTAIAVNDQVTFDGWTFRVAHVSKGRGLDWDDHVKVMLERGRRA